MGFEDVAKRMKERDNNGAFSTPSEPPQFISPDQLMAESARAQRRSRANGDIIFGIILLIVGIAITSFTYDSASREGGTYIVAYGPIVVGVIKLIRGIATLGG